MALFTRVCEEVIENAVEHAKADSVHVRISATTDTDGRVTLVIADDGPGLPPHEKVSLETDEETAVDHGSGLGLWLVRCGLTTLGGEVTYEESEWGGTAIHLRLPPAPPEGITTAG